MNDFPPYFMPKRIFILNFISKLQAPGGGHTLSEHLSGALRRRQNPLLT